MSPAAAMACVEQLLGASLRQALPELEQVAAAAEDEVERANAQLILQMARELIRTLEADAAAFRAGGGQEPADGAPRCGFCWRGAGSRVSRVA
ncbi:hypothetical protein [Anaeromyxobacter paludicola]|uniref:Uncharacterized protein n=1 Tax=Anaeromyxobacter paludicola TaxID=2918171 RepID=A0ABM7X571_9BACT|nr:hypothetical protein [Anaeromyxobacter paludicola]BDG06962.1 hypothetical protein AMPC_00750 [Anaeromyxobacter paludicola]